MSHAILLEIEGLDNKIQATSLAQKIEEFVQELHDKEETNAYAIGHQTQEFNPDHGGVCIYQP